MTINTETTQTSFSLKELRYRLAPDHSNVTLITRPDATQAYLDNLENLTLAIIENLDNSLSASPLKPNDKKLKTQHLQIKNRLTKYFSTIRAYNLPK